MGRGRLAPSQRRAAVVVLLAAAAAVCHVWRRRSTGTQGVATAATAAATAATATATSPANLSSRPRTRAPAAAGAFSAASFGPRYAAIVIDDNSGAVLHEASADELRHPASLDQGHDALSAVRADRGRQVQARHAATGFHPRGGQTPTS